MCGVNLLVASQSFGYAVGERQSVVLRGGLGLSLKKTRSAWDTARLQ
jgi:hypothetical protein